MRVVTRASSAAPVSEPVSGNTPFPYPSLRAPWRLWPSARTFVACRHSGLDGFDVHNVVTMAERAPLAVETNPRKSPAVPGVTPTLAPSPWKEVANSARRRENGIVVPTVSQSNTPTSIRMGI